MVLFEVDWDVFYWSEKFDLMSLEYLGEGIDDEVYVD